MGEGGSVLSEPPPCTHRPPVRKHAAAQAAPRNSDRPRDGRQDSEGAQAPQGEQDAENDAEGVMSEHILFLSVIIASEKKNLALG